MSLLLLFSLVISAFRCDEDKDPEFVFMAFLIPISISPQTQQVNLGDTISISANFPDTLKEYYSNKYYRLPNFDFKSSICFSKLTDNQLYLSEQPAAFESFTIVPIIGSLNQASSKCGSIQFSYSNDAYSLTIGLVGNQIGLFSMSFLWPIHGIPGEEIDLRPVIDLGTTADGRNRIPVYEAFYFVVNDGNTNFDLFKENCKAASLENPAPINVFYEQKGSYTFRVVE